MASKGSGNISMNQNGVEMIAKILTGIFTAKTHANIHNSLKRDRMRRRTHGYLSAWEKAIVRQFIPVLATEWFSSSP